MSNGRDFFDDDLTDDVRDVPPEDEEDISVSGSITEASLTRMARQRKEINQQVAGAVREIEQLRRRQQDLEREKESLEDLTQRQESYASAKREIIENLSRSTIMLQKEEARAVRAAELMSVIRTRFKECLTELQAIDEENWTDEAYREELNRAASLVDEAQKVYDKALAKLDAENWPGTGNAPATAAVAEKLPRSAAERHGFGYWLKAGLAASLPLIVVLIALFVLWLAMTGWI